MNRSFLVSLLALFVGCGERGEVCDDALDNDEDGWSDCSDQDCFTSCDEACANERDDDGDAAVDCDDADCASSCLEACADGEDNDADGHVDCTDPDCAGRCSEDCANGEDDDGDYLVDCSDDVDCRPLCDADGDDFDAIERGGTDCDDADSAVHPGAVEAPYDGQDDDCDPSTPDDDVDADGFLLADDCDDAAPLVYPGAPETCGDGVVDDCDAVGTPPRTACYGDRPMGTADAMLLGASTDDYTGFSAAAAGDLDGDGVGDLVVGAYGEGANGTGAVYLVRGPVTGPMEMANADAKLVGTSEDDWTGYSVASAGDPNGNGLADVIVGAQYDDATGDNAGAAYVVRGSSLGDILLDEADLKLLGADSNDRAGYAVAGAGDVNGDTLDDLLVGALQSELAGSDAGATYLVYGGVSGVSLLAFAPVTFLGMGVGDNSGCALDGGGDADGDALADVLVGACSADRQGAPNSGAAYLHVGVVDGTFQLASGAGTFVGEGADDAAGTSVAFAGDLDDDGLADFVVGGPNHDGAGVDAGAAYVFLGPGDAMPLPEATLLGEADGDRAGVSVDGAGDVDGDGFDDLIIGAPNSDAAGEDAGLAWIVFGPVSGERDLADADVRLTGAQPFDFAGQSVAGAGDLDGDGFDDVLVGAPFADALQPTTGVTYVFTFGY